MGPRTDRGLLLKALTRFGLGIVVIGAMLFGPAGTLHYWPGWVYCGVLFVPMIGAVSYLIRREPDVLRRRMEVREKETTQKRVIAASSLLFVAAFILPGFDHRFGWSDVPTALILAANAVVFVCYLGFVWVIRTNAFAARTVRVEEGQKVITTGPYAIVRHPMYTCVSVMMMVTPLALGSYWAVLPMLLLPALLVLRIRNEEEVLRRELDGYPEYCDRVRSRLIPGIW